MRIRIFPTPRDTARALAAEIARTIARRPSLVLGLPTGRTPIPLYRELATMCRRGQIDFSRATTFNLDEFVGISGSDPHSYRAFMQRHLFDHVNLPARRIHVLNGAARNTTEECARFERAIARAGGIDLMVLGLGTNGHIGFNEPGRHLVARTHRTVLTRTTRAANAALFGGSIRRVPREGLSMGIMTILQASRIVVLATGATKTPSVRRMIEGPVTPRLPASFLQMHRFVDVWLDRAAAARLPRRSATREGGL